MATFNQYDPIQLTFGVEMKHPNLIPICDLINEEYAKSFSEDRDAERREAKQYILKAQEEQRKTFNRKRVMATEYNIGDLVAIKRTQFLPMSTLKSKYLGPYRIVGRAGRNRYNVIKLRHSEGPTHTSTGSDFIKRWRECSSSTSEEEVDGAVSEADSA
jgi:hypothetical protein